MALHQNKIILPLRPLKPLMTLHQNKAIQPRKAPSSAPLAAVFLFQSLFHHLAKVLVLLLQQSHYQPLHRQPVRHTVQRTHMSHNAVYLPHTAKTQTNGGRHRMIRPAQWLKYSLAQQSTRQQVHQIVHRLVARTPSRSRKPELLLILQTIAHAKPKVGHYQRHYKHQHPPQVKQCAMCLLAQRAEKHHSQHTAPSVLYAHAHGITINARPINAPPRVSPKSVQSHLPPH